MTFTNNHSVGQLIVFEGPDGVGKSTLSKALSESLTNMGISCKYFSFPGKEKGSIGRIVYDLHHSPEKFDLKEIHPISLQALHIAAHLDAIENMILPSMKRGSWIILDRFWWSTWVYGRKTSNSSSVLDALINAEQIQWGDTKSSIVFLIDRLPESHRNSDHADLWKNYEILRDKECKKYPVKAIQNNESIQDAMRQVIGTLKDINIWPQNGIHDKETNQYDDRIQLFPIKPIPKKLPTYILKELSPAKPTIVYNTYWIFATERQDIFFRKLQGLDGPWTDDLILRRHKFTNAYRASDRVSQYLIRHVIYEGDQSPVEVFFRTILFKLFNKIETWEILKSKLGMITYEDYSFPEYDRILSEVISSGGPIYSAAYMMPPGKKAFGHTRKHRNHLSLIERMMDDEVPKKIADSTNMCEAFEVLCSYPTIGNFLAYQFITDLNYSEIVDFSEMQFVIPGPGALDGIHKCFSNLGGLSEADLIRLVTDRQEKEFERLGLKFRTLGGRPLQLIDCQNLFCEISKYARLKHPEIIGIGNRTRIKQVYRPSPKTIRYWYPPKWRINHQIGD